MRDMAMTGKQAISAGTAAAVSLVKDIKRSTLTSSTTRASRSDVSPSPSSAVFRAFSGDLEMPDPEGEYCTSPTDETPVTFPGISGSTARRMTVHGISGGVDLDTISTAQGDGRLEDTFNQVKAELASGPSMMIPDSSAKVCLAAGARPNFMDSVAHAKGTWPSVVQDPVRDRSDDSQQSPDYCDREGHHRSAFILSKIRDLDSRMSATNMALDSDLRIARNLRVLTPFQRSTRQRIQNAVEPVARRVKQLRLDLVKLQCQRDILAADLAADEEDRKRTKCVALTAATKELRVRTMSMGHDPLPPSPATAPSQSTPEDGALTTSSSATLSVWTTAERPHSSTSSFYTAIDDPSGVDNSTTSMLEHVGVAPLTPPVPPVTVHPLPDIDVAIQVNDEPLNIPNMVWRSPALAPSDWTAPPRSPVASASIESPTTTEPSSRDPDFGAETLPDEEAEDWSKTRAAKRVSLVTVPPQIISASRLSAVRRERIRSDGMSSLGGDTLDHVILQQRRVVSENP